MKRLKLPQRWSAADDLIVDPFMGSGTTIRAAKDFGRREAAPPIAAQRDRRDGGCTRIVTRTGHVANDKENDMSGFCQECTSHSCGDKKELESEIAALQQKAEKLESDLAEMESDRDGLQKKLDDAEGSLGEITDLAQRAYRAI